MIDVYIIKYLIQNILLNNNRKVGLNSQRILTVFKMDGNGFYLHGIRVFVDEVFFLQPALDFIEVVLLDADTDLHEIP